MLKAKPLSNVKFTQKDEEIRRNFSTARRNPQKGLFALSFIVEHSLLASGPSQLVNTSVIAYADAFARCEYFRVPFAVRFLTLGHIA